MTTHSNGTPEPGPDAGIDALKADAEQTRHDLADTVGALSDKLDVKGRAEQKVSDTKEAVQQRTQQMSHDVATTAREKPVIPVAALAAVLGVAGLIWWWRRR